MRSRIVKATKQRPSKSKKTAELKAETPITGEHSSVSGTTPTEVKAPLAPASDGSEEAASKSPPKEHRKGTILNPDLIEVPTPDEKSKKLRRREMESMQQKAIVANLGRSNCGKQASKGKVNNRIGMINQPKKGF